ncbi:unnamed protein product [Polarella glacialis]|uniref:Uncharacterized protein n=1 Tax=Polarella glacialis TaxID=89957 RepID=A0A813F5A3_POLGL|nr:unnamed protein product [Polarella glacialis]
MIVRVEGAEFDSGFVLFNSQAAIFVVEPNAAVTERQIGEWSCINGKIASAKWQGVTTPYCETDDYRISEQTKRLALGGVLQSNTTNGPNGTNISFRIATEILLTLSGTAPRLSHIRMKFQVQTPADRTNFLLERWFLEITRIDEPTGKLVIVSTNDGVDDLSVNLHRGVAEQESLLSDNNNISQAGVNLAVVTQLPTSPNPVALHNAPLTVIQVKLELDPLDSDAEAIVLSGPPGYRFPANCTVPNQGDRVANAEAMRCIALPYADTLQGMLPRVRLDCMVDRDFFEYVYVPGKGTDCLRKVATTIYVETPALTPSYNDWFVEAVDVTRAPEMPGGRNFTSVGDRLGRGTFQGFDIVDMSAWAVYAALASVSLDIGISFESRVDMPPLGEVFITAPETLTNFGCSNRRGEILPLSLGPVLSCTTGLEPKSVRLKLNSTLKAGLQLILIPGETSSEPSSIGEKVFQIFLVGPDGKNLDVALSVPAEKVQQGRRAQVWPLWWTKLIWGKPFFYVTIPLEVISEAGMSLRALLIDLPMSPESGGLQFYGTDFEAGYSGMFSVGVHGIKCATRTYIYCSSL